MANETTQSDALVRLKADVYDILLAQEQLANQIKQLDQVKQQKNEEIAKLLQDQQKKSE
jgi:hypothetical protein